MTKKLRVALLFGGKSAEHEVSLQSAKNIFAALDKEKFEPILIGIDKQGIWHHHSPEHFLSDTESTATIHLEQITEAVTLSGNNLVTTSHNSLGTIDVVFPILHGPLGEDGTVQGLLRLADLPFVGCDVLSSAVGMDKDVMKRLLRDAGIPVAPFVILKSSQKDEANFTSITNTLGKPIFVKPANMGSSVGISKVTTSEEFNMAVEKAFNHDTKIIIEAAVIGEEIECALLGNDQPQTSVIGKITPHAEFYSYEAKYLDPNGAALEIPAIIPENITKKAQNLALKTFKTLECSGLARVDMFVTSTGEVLVNEINTMPGFTSISMYPKLWEASGITYSELITRLIELALERAASKRY